MTGIKIGVTGTRKGWTDAQRAVFIQEMDYLRDHYTLEQLHHGDCMGVDAQVVEKSLLYPFQEVWCWPGDAPRSRAYTNVLLWGHHDDGMNDFGPFAATPRAVLKLQTVQACVLRDKQIVNHSDVLFGFPPNYVQTRRSGTWSTIRHGLKTNTPTKIIYPDGRTEEFDWELPATV